MSEVTAYSPVHRAAFLELEFAASAAYNRFVYRDTAQAEAIRGFLLDSDRAEFGPSRSRIVVEGGALMGIVSCLSGAELSRCRMRCAYALAKSDFFSADPHLQQRIGLAAQALARPDPQDHYLSRIAVAEAAAGRNVAQLLLDHCEREAAEAGAKRILLEVAAGNARAIAFYRRNGFLSSGEASVTASEGARTLSYVHMAKTIA